MDMTVVEVLALHAETVLWASKGYSLSGLDPDTEARLRPLRERGISLAEHASTVSDAAAAAATAKQLDPDTAARIGLLAKLWVAGFTTSQPVLQATDAWHFGAAARIGLAREILFVRVGPSKEQASTDYGKQVWQQDRIENLTLLERAVSMDDRRWRPLVDDTARAVEAMKKPGVRLKVPAEAVAAAVATLTMATHPASPQTRLYARVVPVMDLPTGALAREQRELRHRAPVEMRVWGQVVAALTEDAWERTVSAERLAVIADAVPGLAPTPGDEVRARLALGLLGNVSRASTLGAVYALSASPEEYGSRLHDVVRSEQGNCVAGPKAGSEREWMVQRDTVRELIVTAVAASWKVTGAQPDAAQAAAAAVNQNLSNLAEAGLGNREVLARLTDVFGVAVHSGAVSPGGRDATTALEVSAPVGAALACAPAVSAGAIGAADAAVPAPGTAAHTAGTGLAV